MTTPPDSQSQLEPETDRVRQVPITEELKSSYLDYAMSVIVGRALPDVRDGLKPVHRRILYAMLESGATPDKPHRKSARIVGDVMGRYHPHGDAAIYDTIVRMVQTFSLRYPLINGQGNFGCFTGDTSVKLLDGTDRTFEELAEMYGPDETFHVYSADDAGNVVVGEARHSRITRKDSEVIELVLDNREVIRCTPDHRFMLRDGTYKQACDLTGEDSLMPGYFSTAPVREGMNDYLTIQNPATGIYEFVHRLEDNPEMMHQLAKQAAGSLRQKWKDDQYKRQVMRSKILRYGSHLLSQNGSDEITPELYDRARYNNCIPRFRKAMGYFESFDEFLSLSATYNHRIVSKRMLDRRFDVYDITVEPYHNFLLGSGVFVHNSIDGDSAAAMRYTEVKMAKVAKELLDDINKDTVDFVPNYDNSLKEPSVLPALLPNLLVNGSTGIAVGMATNMPPHNLGEVVDGTIHLIDNPDATVHELMAHVKAPDFPTAAAITGLKGVLAAYTTGRGIVEMIARTEIETKKDRERIIVTELPYRVNKAKLVENIADLVKGKQVEGISDLRDESDKDGIRVVIETRKGANTQVILNQLYKHTQLKTTFGIINLVLVNGEPKVLPLKGLIQCYIDHRKEIIIRRSRYDLKKAEDRLHILDGLKIALDNIDAVIKLIRSSKTAEAARDGLIANFGLSEVQAKAILEMQLRRLTGIEREKLEEEYASLEETIAFLREVLANPQKVLDLIKEELLAIKEKYADLRRTEILEAHEEFEDEDLIPSEDAIITISNTGYIKRVPVDTYRQQGRGGRGVIGMGTKEEDVVEDIFIANTHDYILFFTDKGKVHWLKVYKIPEGSRQSKGKAIVNLLELSGDENVTAFVKVSTFDPDHYLVMATKRGVAKRTALSEFARPRKGGIIALKLDIGDELVSVRMVADSDDILIGTAHAKAIRFHAPDVRSMGRSARGVRGISLAADDYVVDMEIVEAGAALLTLTENGYGKRTEFDEYRVTRRGGKGIITIIPNLRNGLGIAIKTVYEDDELLVTSQNGNIIRIPVRDIRMQGRNTQGVRIMRLDPGDRAVAVARVGRLTDNDMED